MNCRIVWVVCVGSLLSFITCLEAAPDWARRGSELAGKKCNRCGFHTRCSKCGLIWFHGPCSCEQDKRGVAPASDICRDCEERAAKLAELQARQKSLRGRVDELKRQINALDSTGRGNELATKLGKAKALLIQIRFDSSLDSSDKASLISRAELKISELEAASRNYQNEKQRLFKELQEAEAEALAVQNEAQKMQ